MDSFLKSLFYLFYKRNLINEDQYKYIENNLLDFTLSEVSRLIKQIADNEPLENLVSPKEIMVYKKTSTSKSFIRKFVKRWS